MIKAFQKASKLRKLEQSSIFHSDRGSQYTAKEFQMLLETMGIKHSYSKKEYNTSIESFNTILKKEEVNANNYVAFKIK